MTLMEIADDLRRRTISLFLADGDGRRPCFGPYEKVQTDPRWKDNLLFNEYFHGDTGEGLGPPTRPDGPGWLPTRSAGATTPRCCP